MSKFKMTVFSEIPVHPITLDEVKGGLANPLGDCSGGSCYCNYKDCNLKIECGAKTCDAVNTPCSPLDCSPKGCSLAICKDKS